MFFRVGVPQLDTLLKEIPCAGRKVARWKLSKLIADKGSKGSRKLELSGGHHGISIDELASLVEGI